MSTPITVIIKGRPQPDADLDTFMNGLVQAVTKEPGTLDYRGFQADGQILLMETYEDAAGFMAHVTDPPVAEALPRFGDFVDVSEVLVLGDVTGEVKAVMDTLGATYWTPRGGTSQLFPQAATA